MNKEKVFTTEAVKLIEELTGTPISRTRVARICVDSVAGKLKGNYALKAEKTPRGDWLIDVESIKTFRRDKSGPKPKKR